MDYTPPPLPPVEIHESIDHYAFVKEPNLAQYKGSDYAGAVRVERGISVEQAFKIANADPDIDYFVYIKGACMVLEIPSNVDFDPESDALGLVTEETYVTDDGQEQTGYCRIFHRGDVVFFNHDGRWLGTAPGLADVYSKKVEALDW